MRRADVGPNWHWQPLVVDTEEELLDNLKRDGSASLLSARASIGRNIRSIRFCRVDHMAPWPGSKISTRPGHRLGCFRPGRETELEPAGFAHDFERFEAWKAVKRLVYRQSWEGGDPVVQLVPSETQTHSIQLTTGLTNERLLEFSANLGLSRNVLWSLT
jgi:hypothetical protein